MKRHAFLQVLLSTSILITLAPVSAIEIDSNGITGNFDTTISWGAARRIESRDPALVGGFPPAGAAYSVNGDDGNLNYDKGLISNVIKVTHDLDLDYKNFGLFLRGNYFYDFYNNDKDELSQAAKDRIGKDADILDAYISGSFDINDRPLDIRVGKQVVSWGESTFIQNSINAINPIDVARFRVPGAELREALIPVPMIWASHEINENISVEAVYIARFVHTEIDPTGAYFSTNDAAGDGGEFITTGFGFVPSAICETPTAPSGPPSYFSNCLTRAADRDAKDSGQYGLALRWFAPELNDTEFGFYYLNYHSRLPIISAIATFVPGASGAGLSDGYFVEYPEDIQLIGLSFNTVLNKSGVALQGELSYRKDVPLQVHFVELLFAQLRLEDVTLSANPAIDAFIKSGFQIQDINAGDEVSGYRLLDVLQYQMTGTKLFGAGNPFNADQMVLLGEIGVTHVLNMPDKSTLRFNGSGTPLPGDPRSALLVPDGSQQIGGFADATSWGYRVVVKLDYNSVGNGINLSPRIVFAHDVNGTSPGPGGNFIEGRKTLTLGLGATYLNKWQADASYTRYSGAGNFNQIHDRDFVAINVKYSF